MTQSTTTLSMTALFTPPSACASSWTYEAEVYNSISGGLLIQNALPNLLDTACFPEGFAYDGRVPDEVEIFSPGACPLGYTTATESFGGGSTLAVCCLSDYSYTSTFSQKNDFNPTTFLFAGCLSTFPSSSTTTLPGRVGNVGHGNGNTGSLNVTQVAGPLVMWGQPISVAFRAKDVGLFTTSASGSTSTGTRTGNGAGTGATPTKSLASATSSSGSESVAGSSPSGGGGPRVSGAGGAVLSSGAKTGIWAGAAVIITAILAASAFVFMLKRRSRREAGARMANSGVRVEKSGWARHEMDASRDVSRSELGWETTEARSPWELDGKVIRAELQ